MKNIGELLKIYQAGFDNIGIKVGYAGTAAELVIAGVYAAVTNEHLSTPSILALAAGPTTLLGFTAGFNYTVGKRKLKKR